VAHARLTISPFLPKSCVAMAAKMDYDEAVTTFDKQLAEDDEGALLALAKDLMESPSMLVKAAACHAVAKSRLKKELMMFQGSSKVFPPLEEALRLYTEEQHTLGEAAVHDTMAQAYLLISELELATSEAKLSARMFGKESNKKGIAATCKTLYEVYLSQGDKQKALMNLKERANVLRGLGEKKELAEALTLLSGMQLEKGLKDAAKSAAEEAAGLLEALGDKAGEKQANKVLSQALVLSGKVDEAPNRTQALVYLRLLGSALERKSEKDFKKALYELSECGGYKEKEVEEALAPIIERDQQAVKFLKELGVKIGDKGELLVAEFTKRWFYINFRLGGIQYGPRFQCVRAFRKEKNPENEYNALATLKPSSLADQWEIEMGYHLGILDGSLQAGSISVGPRY